MHSLEREHGNPREHEEAKRASDAFHL